MYLRMLQRLLWETDKRLLWKLAWNMGWKGMRSVEKHKRRPLLVSTDVYRPAAMTQLERLAAQVGAGWFAAPAGAAPVEIATAALDHARRHQHDVLIVDTAGRLHVDAGMMDEVRAIDRATGATERLFVVDSMAGQDAVRAALPVGIRSLLP